MSIDITARKRLQEENRYRQLADAVKTKEPITFDAIRPPLENIGNKTQQQIGLFTIILSTIQSIADYLPKMLAFLPSREDIKDINRSIARIPQPKLEVPDEMTINPVQVKILKDAIDAIKFPDIPSTISISNLQSVIRELQDIKKGVNRPQKDISIPKQESIDLSPLLNELRALRLELPEREMETYVQPSNQLDVSPIVEAIDRIPGGVDNTDVIRGLDRVYDAIATLANKPTMTPSPVNHVSINGLNGAIKTTQIQLGSIATPLPAIPLANRRSLQFYNNGTTTFYFGDSTVTTAKGIPVTSGSYSDIIDAGVNMTIYGISQTGQNNDIRVLEVSDIAMGT